VPPLPGGEPVTLLSAVAAAASLPTSLVAASSLPVMIGSVLASSKMSVFLLSLPQASASVLKKMIDDHKRTLLTRTLIPASS
jgi:hypothetical protein